MFTSKKPAGASGLAVNDIYKRAFSCLHVVEQYSDERDPGEEVHETSLMFSCMLGHLHKKGPLDAKTLHNLLVEIETDGSRFESCLAHF